MRALLIGLGLSVVLTVSCKKKLIEPPDDLIPEDKMIEILYDLAVLNGIQSTNPAVIEEYKIETMPYIYDKHEVDSLQFVLSDQYYASVPEIYQSLYQEVEKRLDEQVRAMEEARKQKNDSIKQRTDKVRDSLRKKT